MTPMRGCDALPAFKPEARQEKYVRSPRRRRRKKRLSRRVLRARLWAMSDCERSPLPISASNVTAAKPRRPVRKTFVAPIFPEPVFDSGSKARGTQIESGVDRWGSIPKIYPIRPAIAILIKKIRSARRTEPLVSDPLPE